MRTFLLCTTLATALGGCVANQAALDAGQAACVQPGATHLQIAQCKSRVLFASFPRRDRDVIEVVAATREGIAAKQDQHLISDEEARVEIAKLDLEMNGVMEGRDARQAQAVAAVLADMRPPPAPAPVYIQAPTPAPAIRMPVNCTSRAIGATVATNCY